MMCDMHGCRAINFNSCSNLLYYPFNNGHTISVIILCVRQFEY